MKKKLAFNLFRNKSFGEMLRIKPNQYGEAAAATAFTINCIVLQKKK